jgi:ADP-ribose pyrophosphatase YjhB (NUDIX family)
MSNTLNFAVTCRAIIVDEGELFMVNHDPKFKFYALPGGRLEVGEHISDCMVRELIEETTIKPDVGKLLIVNDWVGDTHQRVEFFFWVRNGADYRRADTAHASHGFEINAFAFGNPADPKYGLLPKFMQQKFPDIVRLGEDFPTELVRSYSEKSNTNN